MNEISKVFENEEFGKVRVVIIDGEPWFVGADIAKILNYADAPQSIRVNCKHARKVDLYARQGHNRGNSEVYVIPESDVYRLVMRSKRPEAEKFEEWVTEEVLPSIRKTGSYVADPFYEYRDRLPKDYVEALRQLADVVEENEQLKLENEEMQPKAEYYDTLVDSSMYTNLTDTAKELGMAPRAFIKWLRACKYVYEGHRDNNLRPYAEFTKGDKPMFVLKDVAGKNDYGTVQTFVTVEGKNRLRKRLARESSETPTCSSGLLSSIEIDDHCILLMQR